VARPTDLAARDELLGRVVDYLATHGLADATLRPMARALGVSPTPLMFHFGSKGGLIAAALDRVEQDLRAIEAGWLTADPSLTESRILRAWWRWMVSSPRHLALARLVVEAAALDSDVTELDTGVRKAQIGNWTANTERRLRALGVPVAAARLQATMLKAVFTGLTVDLAAGGNPRRLARVLDLALEDHERRVAALLDHSNSS
jgi:AcrR family transcriptional regulator